MLLVAQAPNQPPRDAVDNQQVQPVEKLSPPNIVVQPTIDLGPGRVAGLTLDDIRNLLEHAAAATIHGAVVTTEVEPGIQARAGIAGFSTILILKGVTGDQTTYYIFPCQVEYLNVPIPQRVFFDYPHDLSDKYTFPGLLVRTHEQFHTLGFPRDVIAKVQHNLNHEADILGVPHVSVYRLPGYKNGAIEDKGVADRQIDIVVRAFATGMFVSADEANSLFDTIIEHDITSAEAIHNMRTFGAWHLEEHDWDNNTTPPTLELLYNTIRPSPIRPVILDI